MENNNPVLEFLRENKHAIYSTKTLSKRLNLKPKIIKFYIAKSFNHLYNNEPIIRHANPEEVGYNGSRLTLYKFN